MGLGVRSESQSVRGWDQLLITKFSVRIRAGSPRLRERGPPGDPAGFLILRRGTADLNAEVLRAAGQGVRQVELPGSRNANRKRHAGPVDHGAIPRVDVVHVAIRSDRDDLDTLPAAAFQRDRNGIASQIDRVGGRELLKLLTCVEEDSEFAWSRRRPDGSAAGDGECDEGNSHGLRRVAPRGHRARLADRAPQPPR